MFYKNQLRLIKIKKKYFNRSDQATISNLAAKAFGKDNKYLDQLIKERFIKGLASREILMKLIADPPLNSSHMVETAAELVDALRREQSGPQTPQHPYGNMR